MNFSSDELKQQIKDAIAPTCNSTNDILELVREALKDDSENDMDSMTNVEIVGWWKGLLEEGNLGVLLDETTLQLYKSCRYGFKPYGLPVDSAEWELKEDVRDYHYEVRGNDIFLIL